MSKRLLGVVIAVVLTLLVAGVLWAAYEKSMGEGMEPGMGMMESAMPAYEKEFDRCTMTCTMLMNHFNKKHATMKAHEGDKQCWDTCWSRMGERKSGSATEMKDMWMKNRAERMRANQCAQACWRKHNQESNTVEVGGWRSTPRGNACTK